MNLKRICAVLLLAAILPLGGTAAESKLLKNGGFEALSGKTPADWVITASKDCSVKVKQDGAFEGDNYLALEDSSTTGFFELASQVVPAAFGKQVQVTLQARNHKNVVKAIRFLTSASPKENENQILSTHIFAQENTEGQEWVTLSGTVDVPKEAKGFQIVIYSVQAKTASGDVDDVSVTFAVGENTPDGTAEQLFFNGGFEDNGGLLADWSFAAGQDCSVSIESENAPEGSQYIKITDDSKTAAVSVTSSVFAVSEGEMVEITLKAKENSNITKAIRFIKSSSSYTGTKNEIISTVAFGHANTLGPDWKSFFGQIPVPEGAKGFVVILYTTGTRLSKGYIDDVSLKIKSNVPMIKDADFTLTDYKNPVHEINNPRTVFHQDSRTGKLLAYTGVRGEVGQLTVVDVVEKKMLRQIPLVDGDHFATNIRGMVLVGSKLYMSGDSGALLSCDLDNEKVEYLGMVPQGFCFTLKQGPEGILLGGSFGKDNGNHGWEYHINTREFKDYGPILANFSYAYSLAYDEKRDEVYFGISTPGSIVRYSRATGEKTVVPLKSELGEPQFITSLAITADHLVIWAGKGAVYNLESREYVDLDLFPIYSLAVSDLCPDKNRFYFTMTYKAHTVSYYDLEQKKVVDTKKSTSEGGAGGYYFTNQLTDEGFAGAWCLVGMSGVGELWYHNTDTGLTKTFLVGIMGENKHFGTVAVAANGDIHFSAHMGGTAIMDPNTGETVENSAISRGQQIKQGDLILPYDKYIYFVTYANAVLHQYDITKPWNVDKNLPEAEKNPHTLFQGFDFESQDRGRDILMIEDHNLLAIGTMPDYNTLGGALLLYDLNNMQEEGYPNIVENQTVNTLAYRDGIIYGGTNIAGGLGSTPIAKEAKLFAFDVKTKTKLWEITPFPGSTVLNHFFITPDGKLWGSANYEIFEFDLETKAVTWSMIVNNSGQAAYQLGNDGNLYVTQWQKFYKINPETKEITIIYENESGTGLDKFTQDVYGNLYICSSTDTMRKISIPALISEPVGAEMEVKSAYIGKPLEVEITGLVANGKKLLYQETKNPVYTSSNPSAVAIRDGQLYAVGEGTSKIQAQIMMNGEKVFTDLAEVTTVKEELLDPILSSSVIMGIGVNRAYSGGIVRYIDPDYYKIRPVVENGRTLVPARFISEAFGAEVDWEAETETAVIKAGETVARLKAGSAVMLLNGESVPLDVPVRILNGRTMLPLRIVAETILSKQVSWMEEGLIVVSDSVSLQEERDRQLMNYLYRLIK